MMFMNSQLDPSRTGSTTSRSTTTRLGICALSIAALSAFACGGAEDAERDAEIVAVQPPTDAEPEIPAPVSRITAEAGELQTSVVRVDLSRPGSVVQIDVSKGSIDLSRIELSVGGQTMSAESLQQTAAASAGFVPADGSFYVVSGADTARSLPGGNHCSPLTQTDCCECGWQIGSLCAGFWCPCFGDECSLPPVLAR